MGAENGNNTKCPDSYGTYRSQENCGAFYVCVAGSPVDFICPGGTNYNDVNDFKNIRILDLSILILLNFNCFRI